MGKDMKLKPDYYILKVDDLVVFQGGYIEASNRWNQAIKTGETVGLYAVFSDGLVIQRRASAGGF